MFRRDKTVYAIENPYSDNFQIQPDRIRKFHLKFIRDKSGLRHPKILQFILQMVKYAFLEERGWQPEPKFLITNKK